MPHSSEIRIVLTTFPNEETASGIIRELVRESLIACGTVVSGCRSIYVWNGRMHDSEEVQACLKTTLTCLAEVERRLTEAHPYDVPEFIVLQAEATSHAYEAWVTGFCNSNSPTATEANEHLS